MIQRLFTVLGNAAALLGIALCLGAGGARLLGHYYVFGFEALTIFIGGIGFMVMGGLAKLHAVSVR